MDQFVTELKKVIHGYEIACKVIESEETQYFIKNRHIGDCMRTMPYVALYKSYYSGNELYHFSNKNVNSKSFPKKLIVKDVAIITTRVLSGVVNLYPDVNKTIVLSRADLDDLELYAQSGMCKHKNLYPDESKSNQLKEKMFMVSSMNWMLNIPMDMPDKKEIIRKSRKINAKSIIEAERFIKQREIIEDRMVVFCPLARSSTSLTQEALAPVIKFFKQNGFVCFTNVGSDEIELGGTERLQVSVDVLCALAKKGALIVGAQSGIMDTLVWLEEDLRLIIISFQITNSDKTYSMNRGITSSKVEKGNATYLLVENAEQMETISYRIMNVANKMIRGQKQYALFQENNVSLVKGSNTLNEYIHTVSDRQVMFVSVCDSANKYWNLFTAKEYLGLREDLSKSWRLSYVGIIDKSENYVYENLKDSYDGATCRYSIVSEKGIVEDVFLSSVAMDCKGYTKASIIINGYNYSLNKRGINIVIFDKEQMRVVDSVNVDLWNDRNLTVNRT